MDSWWRVLCIDWSHRTQDVADVAALKASVERLFAEALRGGAARRHSSERRSVPGAAAVVACEGGEGLGGAGRSNV